MKIKDGVFLCLQEKLFQGVWNRGLQEKTFCVNILRNVKRMFRKYYKNI